MQAIFNFTRKSTDGFSIGNILLDFTGGLANYAQMAVQSIDQGLWSRPQPNKSCNLFLSFMLKFSSTCAIAPFPDSWVNFYGNIGKTLLSLVWIRIYILNYSCFCYYNYIKSMFNLFLILFYFVSNWTSSGDTCLYIDGFYYFRYLYSLTFFSWDNISCCILPRDSLLNSARRRALNHLSSLLMTQYLKTYESFGCSIDICID